MENTFHFSTSHIGSVPHIDSAAICERLVSTLDIPAWPQLPHRTFKENMYVQFGKALPGVIVDESRERILFDTADDLTPALERFYEHYLADDLEYFGLSTETAQGFYSALDTLSAIPGEWAKGQVTGPISLGLTVTDEQLRASLYNELLADTIVKNAAMNARWQVRQLRKQRPNVVIFVDEPYMASFGSAYISLSREQVITMLDEVFAAIHQEGALAGVHCCANTDWSVLLATTVDILNLDAFGYLENLALYPAELRAFLDRGGTIAWGMIPNDETIVTVTASQLAERMRAGLELISQKAIARGVPLAAKDFEGHSLLTPSCGLGSASVDTAERVFETLMHTGELLQRN